MYLGEVVRRVLLKMAKETALFGETIPSKLAVPYMLRFRNFDLYFIKHGCYTYMVLEMFLKII